MSKPATSERCLRQTSSKHLHSDFSGAIANWRHLRASTKRLLGFVLGQLRARRLLLARNWVKFAALFVYCFSAFQSMNSKVAQNSCICVTQIDCCAIAQPTQTRLSFVACFCGSVLLQPTNNQSTNCCRLQSFASRQLNSQTKALREQTFKSAQKPPESATKTRENENATLQIAPIKKNYSHFCSLFLRICIGFALTQIAFPMQAQLWRFRRRQVRVSQVSRERAFVASAASWKRANLLINCFAPQSALCVRVWRQNFIYFYSLLGLRLKLASMHAHSASSSATRRPSR